MLLTDGTLIDRTTAGYKFGGDPMAEYLFILSMEPGTEHIGESDYGLWVTKFGRRLLMSNDQGFVWVERYDTEFGAQAAYDDYEENYNAWYDTNYPEGD